MRRCFRRFLFLGGKGLIGCGVTIAFTACGGDRDPPRAPFVPLADLERTYGHLVTAGNHPTPDQNGTGDRVGFFLDESGNVWGLPLTITGAGAVLGCAPAELRHSRVTDTYEVTDTIIGATNEPTGWRGGTGKMELLLKGRQGNIHWRAISGARIASGSVCWAQESPGPPQLLRYYRLAPISREN
jgi:hypothetical protein